MTAPAVMPGVTVRRDGENRRCDARGLVRGDLVFLRAGDIVPADCRLIFSRGLVVFEEQATGVPGVVRKNAGLISRANTVYAGSSVIAGECSGVVVYTGDETLLVRTRGYFSPQRGRMKLSRMLDTYSRKWGAVMAALAFFVTVLDLFFGGRGIYEVFFLGLSLAVAAMCEYYSALGDIAVAFGMHALAKRTGAALRGVQSVEAAANIDTLIVPADGVIVRDGVECRAVYYNGAIGEIGNDGAPDTPDALFDWAVAAVGGEDGKGSDVTGTLREYIKIAGAGDVPDGMREIYSSVPEDGLSFDTRLYAVEDGFMSVSCGDAAAIVGACAFVGKDGEKFPMTDELRAGILGFVAHHERRGAVAAAISRKRTPFSSRERMMFTQTDMELYGIFILYKPLAEGTEDAVASCAGAGIRVIMTGDGVTAARLADRAGIISGKDDIITGRQFLSLPENDRAAAADRARLLLGFDAEATSAFTSSLRGRGRKLGYVAVRSRDMRGELRELGAAEASFALSSEGASTVSADTLRMHADVIVPRAEDGGGFPAVVSVISHARRIFKNISNIADYMLTSQAARIFAVLLTVFMRKSAINAPVILLWGLIFDFFAVLVLASERPDETSLADVPTVYARLAHPLSKLGKTFVFGLLWAVVTVLTPLLHMGENAEEMGAAVIFVSALLSGVVICGEYRSSYPLFSYKRELRASPILMACAVALTVIVITVFPPAAGALMMTQPDAIALLISVIPALVMLAAYEVKRYVAKKPQKQTETDISQ